VSALFEYLLRLGDSDLILSHRLSELVGHAPAIEEELAIGNTALDLLGQAQLWLTLAAEIANNGRDADRLVYLRDAGEYRNVLLVEQPNGDFAHTITRQFFFDALHHLQLGALTKSSNEQIAAIAAKSIKEVNYHLRRSRDWVITLGDGSEESHRRMKSAVDDLWSYTGELFEMDAVDRELIAQGVAVDRELIAQGVAVDLEDLRAPWLQLVTNTFDEATLNIPQNNWAQRGGKRGVHSEHLGYLLAEMQFLQRAYPNSTW
jgi:ring-1,2-phenylacetyl-CoA epoxidase subunit PaaC